MLYLNVKVPSDLRIKAAGQRVALPVEGEYRQVAVGKTHVKASLQTKDTGVAKARFVASLAALQTFWDALRRGPQPLTHKQMVAIAGEVRQRVLGVYDDNPGDPAMWRGVLRLNERLAAGDVTVPGVDTADPLDLAEQRYGKALDMVLTARALVIDPADRAPLLEAAAKAMQEAAVVNLRKAEGDYSPDPGVARYPAFEVPAEATATTSPALSFAALFGFWEKEHLADGKRPRTARDFRQKLDSLAAFVGHDDAAAVTETTAAAALCRQSRGGCKPVVPQRTCGGIART